MINIFRHYIPITLLIKSVLEFLLLWLAIPVSNLLNIKGNLTTDESLGVGLIYACVFILVMSSVGLFNRFLREDLSAITLRMAFAFIVVAVLMQMVFYVWPSTAISGISFIYALILSVFILTFTRLSCYFLVKHNKLYRKKIIVYGTGHRASLLSLLRRKNDRRHFDCVGFIPVGGEESKVDHSLIIEPPEKLLHLVKSKGIDQIVVALDDKRQKLPTKELLDNKIYGTEVIEMEEFLERNTGRIKLQAVKPSYFIFSKGFIQSNFNASVKRLLDIVAAMGLLLFTMPIMLITALCIMLESGFKGTIFYRQIRVGQNNQLFEIIKFRSMSMDAEKNGAQWASKNDSRVTKVGQFIRKTRIDELPQLINVLKGEMSFVGPRPERPTFVKDLSQSIPFYEVRHFVKPGITGWAQICYPYGDTNEDAKNKLEFDLYYMKNYSLFLDIMIILHTIQVVLWRQGSR